MDSDDENEETPLWKGGATGSIILINAFDPMNFNTAATAFAATCQMIRENMRSSSSRVIGACLFGTNQSETTVPACPNMVELLPFSIPTLEDFRKLHCANVASYGQAKELKLSDVLWYCSRVFANYKRHLSERSLLMLTRLDEPPINIDKRPTLKRVVDLVNLGINLQIINISENSYIVDPFYKELLQASSNNQIENIPKEVWQQDDIKMHLQQHTHRHLAVSNIKFHIGEHFSISVGVYNLTMPRSLPKKVPLNRESNKIISSNIKTLKVIPESVSDTREYTEDSTKEKPILKAELLFYQFYGNEKIEFNDKEKNEVNNAFGSKMLKLLGFKPSNILPKEKWFLQKCAFLFPNENLIQGSTITFKSLYKACTEMSVIAICVFCTRLRSKPHIVALKPSTKPLGLDIEFGFDMIYIPSLENLKEIPCADDVENVYSSKYPIMKDLIKTLSFDFKPNMFESPKLQSLYRGIEALALEEENVENFDDTTKLNVSKFQDINSDLFQQIFGPFTITPTKRSKSNNDSGPKPKRAHIEDIDEDQLKLRVQDNQVDKYTVPELKQILLFRNPSGMPALTSLKKKDLVQLVHKYCT